MTTTEQATHKTVVGVCESVVIKGEWHEFNILIEGNTYPLKLSTKKQELVTLGEALAKGKVRAEWGYLERQGNPNPHRPGTFYMDRYLDSAKALDDIPDTDPATTPAMPHPAELPDAPPPPVDWDAKDLRRHRQAAVAIAVSWAELQTVPSAVDVFGMAEEIVQFVYHKVTYAEPDELIEGLAEEDLPF